MRPFGSTPNDRKRLCTASLVDEGAAGPITISVIPSLSRSGKGDSMYGTISAPRTRVLTSFLCAFWVPKNHEPNFLLMAISLVLDTKTNADQLSRDKLVCQLAHERNTDPLILQVRTAALHDSGSPRSQCSSVRQLPSHRQPAKLCVR